MLVDGIAKQASVLKNRKERKKDCYQKVCFYTTYVREHKRPIKGTTLLGIIRPYHFKNRTIKTSSKFYMIFLPSTRTG